MKKRIFENCIQCVLSQIDKDGKVHCGELRVIQTGRYIFSEKKHEVLSDKPMPVDAYNPPKNCPIKNGLIIRPSKRLFKRKKRN